MVLRRYLEGDECDPKGAFRLADDRWDLGAYSPQGHWRMDSRYRVNFGLLQSFLRPYAKWYVYERVILQRGAASPRASTLVSVLRRADRWLLAHDVRGLDQLAAPDVFAEMWDGLLEPLAPGEQRSVNSVSRQLRTAPFWRALRAEFGSPTVILPIAAHRKPSPTDLMLRDDRVLPSPVIAQILNRLALHRDGTEPLDNYDLLRACVLACAHRPWSTDRRGPALGPRNRSEWPVGGLPDDRRRVCASGFASIRSKAVPMTSSTSARLGSTSLAMPLPNSSASVTRSGIGDARRPWPPGLDLHRQHHPWWPGSESVGSDAHGPDPTPVPRQAAHWHVSLATQLRRDARLAERQEGSSSKAS